MREPTPYHGGNGLGTPPFLVAGNRRISLALEGEATLLPGSRIYILGLIALLLPVGALFLKICVALRAVFGQNQTERRIPYILGRVCRDHQTQELS
jgi:hypothetical protein